MNWITGVFGLALIGLALFSPGPGDLGDILEDGISWELNGSQTGVPNGTMVNATSGPVEEAPQRGAGVSPGVEPS